MEKTPFSFYKIRFSDCDLFGHLNNARYIDYFLNAREDHLKDHYNIDLKDFYGQGTGWLVGSHEIIYRKPARYNERVYIGSTLLKIADDNTLLVEMLMMDEKQSHIKSIMWTAFIPVNVKTGKREAPPASFLKFAKTIENDIDSLQGLKAREISLRSTPLNT